MTWLFGSQADNQTEPRLTSIVLPRALVLTESRLLKLLSKLRLLSVMQQEKSVVTFLPHKWTCSVCYIGDIQSHSSDIKGFCAVTVW